MDEDALQLYIAIGERVVMRSELVEHIGYSLFNRHIGFNDNTLIKWLYPGSGKQELRLTKKCLALVKELHG